MRQPAHGDLVHARGSHSRGGFRCDAARGFGNRPPLAHAHSSAQIVQTHVVQQHHIHTQRQRHIQLRQRVHLQLNLDHMAHARPRPAHGCSQISGQGNVVVLDEHGIIQTKAVIAAAAHAHRVLLQRTQARHGLARASHAGAKGLDGLGNRMRGCGHTA